MKLYNENNIDILIENKRNTPRMSVCFYFKKTKKEKYSGINSLLARLLLQGTKTKSAVELNDEFENNCIDISFKAKQDYIKASLVFLNEDFKKAMELFSDLILNSTFDDFEKEIYKIKGEITADLDNPRVYLGDLFVKNLFKNHPYGSTLTKIIENIDNIKKEDIFELHKQLLSCKKAIVCVGHVEDEKQIVEYFENTFSFMKTIDAQDEIEDIFVAQNSRDEIFWKIKEDAKQAQIIQGWIIDSFNSKDYAKFSILNNILGAGGLSSRLFVNLRDKQGLAYTVRSQYETLLHSGIFSMYIGTAPKNIQKSIDGFKLELQKIAQESVTNDEIQGARENIIGKLKYFTQTNSQISSTKGYDFVMGLGLNFNDDYIQKLNNVTPQDVSDMAKKLLNLPKTIAIVAPSKVDIIL